MPFATAHTISLHGALGHLIDVQADVSSGIVGTTVVGRPDVSLNEARDRCRMAVVNSGPGAWPTTRRVTILLSPADLPSAAPTSTSPSRWRCWPRPAKLPRDALAGTVFIGELTLSGGLRAVPGVLPMMMAAAGPRHPSGVRPRAAGPRGRHGARAWRCSGMRSLGPGGRRAARRGGADGAAGRADVRQPAADLAR